MSDKNSNNQIDENEQLFLTAIKISAVYRINHNAGLGQGFLSNKGTNAIKADIEQSIMRFKQNNHLNSLTNKFNNDLGIAQSIGDIIGLSIINEMGDKRINKYSPFTSFVRICPEIVRRTCFFSLAYLDVFTKGFIDYLLPDLINRLINGYNESLFELPSNLVKSSIDKIVNYSIKLDDGKVTTKTIAAEPIKNIEKSTTSCVSASNAKFVRELTSNQNLSSNELKSAVERVKVATEKLVSASRTV